MRLQRQPKIQMWLSDGWVKTGTVIPATRYIGKTMDGRILFMVVDRKGSRTFRIGSARDADFGQKRFYRRKSRKQR